MKGNSDFQRGRVYAWENRVAATRDASFVAFPDAQPMVNAIWSEMGLKYPPRVEPLSNRATVSSASANRPTIFLSARVASSCLLHEIAHTMTSTMDGQSDGHGELFMGVYVRLLARYLRLDPTELVWSVRSENIQIKPNASPLFVDA